MISDESFANADGSATAIAFQGDAFSTSSTETKELFIKGLTYHTQYALYNESLNYFDQALVIDQNFTKARYAKGVAFHNLKRYDEAVRCYDRALELDPQDADIWHTKGMTLRD